MRAIPTMTMFAIVTIAVCLMAWCSGCGGTPVKERSRSSNVAARTGSGSGQTPAPTGEDAGTQTAADDATPAEGDEVAAADAGQTDTTPSAASRAGFQNTATQRRSYGDDYDPGDEWSADEGSGDED